jgi:hypothetical protein
MYLVKIVGLNLEPPSVMISGIRFTSYWRVGQAQARACLTRAIGEYHRRRGCRRTEGSHTQCRRRLLAEPHALTGEQLPADGRLESATAAMLATWHSLLLHQTALAAAEGAKTEIWRWLWLLLL